MLEFLKDHAGWIVTLFLGFTWFIKTFVTVNDLKDKVIYLEKDVNMMKSVQQEHTYKISSNSERIVDVERAAERLMEVTNRLNTNVEVLASILKHHNIGGQNER
jgi:hypothetical protein